MTIDLTINTREELDEMYAMKVISNEQYEELRKKFEEQEKIEQDIEDEEEQVEEQKKEIVNALIPSTFTSLCEVVADDKEDREILKYILIEKNGNKVKGIATNGCVMGILTSDTLDAVDNYPDGKQVKWEKILLHKDTVKTLEKTIPKKSCVSPLPDTLACIDEITDEFISLRNTNLERANLQMQKITNVSFTPYKQVIPNGNAEFTITIGIPVLEKIVKMLKKLDVSSAKFEFYGKERAFKLTSKVDTSFDCDIEIIAMPIKEV